MTTDEELLSDADDEGSEQEVSLPVESKISRKKTTRITSHVTVSKKEGDIRLPDPPKGLGGYQDWENAVIGNVVAASCRGKECHDWMFELMNQHSTYEQMAFCKEDFISLDDKLLSEVMRIAKTKPTFEAELSQHIRDERTAGRWLRGRQAIWLP